MPAILRRKLGLRPGQPLLWKMISETECRVLVVRQPVAGRSHPARGFMKQFQKAPAKSTAEWMKLLREGEEE